jgi:DNA-binding MarR family transcriptional regulator
MKEILKQMDKAFESRVRVGIMALLLVNEWIDFNALKQRLGITDGNLASHTTALEKKGFIEVRKQFIGKRPNTTYKVTDKGKEAFARYITALKELLNIKV